MKKGFMVCASVLLTAAVFLAGCGTKAAMEEGVSFDGNTLTVILASNPTTGYTWDESIAGADVLEFANDVYTMGSSTGSAGNAGSADSTGSEGSAGSTGSADSASAADSGMTGVGGFDVFTFKSLKEGTAVVTFTYGQQWDGGTKAETRSLHVTVDAKGKITAAAFSDQAGSDAVGSETTGSGSAASDTTGSG